MKKRIYDALREAVEHAERKDLMQSGEYRLTASRDGSRWVFWFVFLPETPGHDLTVTVSDEGQIDTLAGM
ncbi:hypothetical protein [Rubrivirga marina]|uniref:Uncharacterized protein n=1 Tax=Rubrivirga marina TaxID=1196024 RepID=A0A271IXU6_9BACT|nr:hypothetical protein [Rubrivirga marina]PAP76022.1 hypothetical protein BSZ37_05980 [Rubrivirga marina]